MMEFLNFTFESGKHFFGVCFLISVIGVWLLLIVDAFTPVVVRNVMVKAEEKVKQ